MIFISLCMIVKNEEERLDLCLKKISSYMDEIIIVDTGSIDRTKEIAGIYTDKVYDFPWTNDFAAARNYSISKASNEFILIIDSDEILENINIEEIKRLIELNPTKIGRIQRINEYTRKGNEYKYKEYVNRLFSKGLYKYEGIIHEQVVPVTELKDNIPNDCETYMMPLSISHFGYEGNVEIRKKKTERNIALLKLALQECPDDPYLLYQLGKSYYMEEDYKSSGDFFGQALYFDLNPQLEYVQDLVESYGYSLINSGQYETALQLLNIYEEFSNSTDFIFLVALILMNNGRFQEAIQEFMKASEKGDCKMEGVNSYLAFYNLGVIYQCLGDKKRAKLYYSQCNNYEAAKSRLKELDRT